MTEKKLLAVLGGPHRNGATGMMLDYAVTQAEKLGWAVERVNLYETELTFCKGCRSCVRTGVCVQQDGIGEMEALLKACDVVILAAPTYWGNVPAAVKNLFDRLLGTAMEETSRFPKPRLSKSQTYILFTACHTPFSFSTICRQSSGAIHAMKEFFKTAGMRCAGSVVYANADGKSGLPERLKKKIDICIRR